MNSRLRSIIPRIAELTNRNMFGCLDGFRLEVGLWQFILAGWHRSGLWLEWRSYFNCESKDVLFELADHFQAHLTTTTAAAMVQSQ